MIRRISEQVVLRPEDLEPFGDDFEVIGVFNPGGVKVNDEIVLLARVAEKPRETRLGFTGLPRFDSPGESVVDWIPEEELDQSDSRVVHRKADDLKRLTSISHLRVFRSSVGLSGDWAPGPYFLPESPFEEYGIEDPRITEIEDKFWITYVAVSRFGVATALASTEDFVSFERHGLIFHPENKDVVLFPRKVGDEYVSLHRPNPSSHFGRPQMWIARSPDLFHWGQHQGLYSGCEDWEGDRVGAGAPPIEIDEGWLEIYHGSQRSTCATEVGAYSAGALLLERENPTQILKRSHEPIMQPLSQFEQTGFVPNVVFSTAVIKYGDSLQLYYGAADTCIGVVEFSQRELLEALH